MKVKIAQLEVGREVEINKTKILRIIDKCTKGEWVLFPEGALSYYSPDETEYVVKMDWQAVDDGLKEVKVAAQDRGCGVLVGTIRKLNGSVVNCAYIIDLEGKEHCYVKNNLGEVDKLNFQPGNELKIFYSNGIKYGVQICREIAFPEQWQVLKTQGAQVVFHLNNAVRATDKVRSNLIVSRAFENQYFVVSANNSTIGQVLPSYTISPTGDILFQSETERETIGEIEINLGEVKNDYLKQRKK